MKYELLIWITLVDKVIHQKPWNGNWIFSRKILNLNSGSRHTKSSVPFELHLWKRFIPLSFHPFMIHKWLKCWRVWVIYRPTVAHPCSYNWPICNACPWQFYFYRPQRNYGKVMFLHLSVILSTGGCLPHTPLGRHPPGRHPLGRHPTGQTLPPGQTLQADTPTPLADTPTQCMLGYTFLPSACWDTHSPPSACWDTHPLPVQCMLGYGQQAGGTHPTGMHSFFWMFLLRKSK